MSNEPATAVNNEFCVNKDSNNTDNIVQLSLEFEGLQLVDEDIKAEIEKSSMALEEESIESSETEEESIDDPIKKKKAERKAAKKAMKAARRAQREGRGDSSAGQKTCDMCGASVDLLIRCTYDESLQWKMVCGKCWKKASGGVVDGDGNHPYYRYGGLWKNRRAQKS